MDVLGDENTEGLELRCFSVRSPKLKAFLAILAAGMAMACARGPEPVNFTDSLTGPVSPALSIPFDKYALTSEACCESNPNPASKTGSNGR